MELLPRSAKRAKRAKRILRVSGLVFMISAIVGTVEQ